MTDLNTLKSNQAEAIIRANFEMAKQMAREEHA